MPTAVRGKGLGQRALLDARDPPNICQVVLLKERLLNSDSTSAAFSAAALHRLHEAQSSATAHADKHGKTEGGISFYIDFLVQ